MFAEIAMVTMYTLTATQYWYTTLALVLGNCNATALCRRLSQTVDPVTKRYISVMKIVGYFERKVK